MKMIQNSIKIPLSQRILILDGGLGTLIQAHHLVEADYRGRRFIDHPKALYGDPEVLVLTQPDILRSIHQNYIEAGADIIETCTFNANRCSQAPYGLEKYIREINLKAVQIAREAVADRPVFIAGSIGPTDTGLSIASDVDHPESRPLDFDAMTSVYEEQIEALLEGHVDLLLFETVFDTLTLKAALYAAENCFERMGYKIPIMVSCSISDRAGRLLCGQQLEAFVAAITPYHPFSIGLNCSFGVRDMAPFIERMAREVDSDIAISCYPNAGLPNADGGYDDDARFMAQTLCDWAKKGWLNIVGGCCGTTADHIREIAHVMRGIAPRKLEPPEKKLRFSGLETVDVDRESLLVAERANVTGSRRFKRLVEQKNWDEAIDVTRTQMKDGAQLIDICMDDAMLNARESMQTFLRRLTTEPEVARYPIVIDSSDFGVIQTALRECPGRCLVNSISLKWGEARFLKEAAEIQKFGAAAVVMAFDEKGQAATTKRRVEILSRSIELLEQKLDFHDIVVDPNILAIGTGLEEHHRQALSFIETCRILQSRYRGLHTIGGLSNLSFSFRGRDDVRSAIHRAFLDEAAGALSLIIANPNRLECHDEELLKLAQNLVRAQERSLDRLLHWMNTHDQQGKNEPQPVTSDAMTPEERLHHAFIHGISRTLERDIAALLERKNPLELIEGPLMNAMNDVGDRFGRGEMFLPQIVRAARLMKQAIAALPLDKAAQTPRKSRKILLATVWGDVHDIGKNIVNIVLTCNGFDVLDLGVMVETERIVAEARAHDVDAIGLSGLISPSLDVMLDVAKALKNAGIHVPLLIGGAAASESFAAIKLEPAYESGRVAYTADASRVPTLLSAWFANPSEISQKIAQKYDEIRRRFAAQKIELRSLEESRKLAPHFDANPDIAQNLDRAIDRGLIEMHWNAEDLFDDLPWPRLERLLGQNARDELSPIFHAVRGKSLITSAHAVFVPARPNGDDIELLTRSGKIIGVLNGFRARQKNLPPLALADYAVNGAIGLFALTTTCRHLPSDIDKNIAQIAANALVDCAADRLQKTLFDPIGPHICPACGYPITPIHELKKIVLALCHAEKLGITLTESMMMNPPASVCGFAIFHPEAHFFTLGCV